MSGPLAIPDLSPLATELHSSDKTLSLLTAEAREDHCHHNYGCHSAFANSKARTIRPTGGIMFT